MPRRVRDAALESRTARAALKTRAKPYFRSIGQGLHVGYRKGKTAGRWVVRTYAGDGAYRVETLADADDALDANGDTVLDFWEAQERARAIHAEGARDGGRTGRAITVADAMSDYLEWMDGARKSARDARYRAEALILPELGSVQVERLTARQIRQWHRDVADSPARIRTRNGDEQQYKESPDNPETIRRRRASANRTLTILKAALNRAWREGQVSTDTEWRRVEPFEAVEAARIRYLSIEEAQRLINAAEPAFRRLVRAALETGARYGELTALRVVDFSDDAGTLAIRQSKSGKARHIVLTDDGIDFFRTITVGRDGAERMFSTKTGAPWTPSAQARPMAEACENARITPPITFHGLRHTWASHAAMNGVPLMVVARNLGHADTRMVERHYGHLSPSYVADAIRAGAPRFGAVETTNVERLS